MPSLRFLFASGLALGAALILPAGEWRPLFNGRDLAGWKQVNGTAPYTVVDGAIVGTTVEGSPNSFLATEANYGDFILEFEMRYDGEPTNSGVQIRSESRADVMAGRVHGYQCEIDSNRDRRWTGGIYDEARRGWLYPVSLNPAAQDAFLYDRWNHFRIEAIGDSIRTWVNGVPVAHVVDAQTRTGFIALQVHSVKAGEAGRRVRFRGLRIQTDDLTPAPAEPIFVRSTRVNQVSAAERAAGWRLLWDGATTAGWQGLLGAAFPAGVWSIRDGELIVGESGGKGRRGDLVTTEEFGAFEFQAEFKLTPGANSGIKYAVTGKDYPEAGPAVGLEFQVLDDERHPDAKLGAAGNRTLGSLYDLIPRNPLPGGLAIVPRVGEWQHARIVVHRDGRVEHWLNGIKVVDYVRGSPLFAALVARSKFAKIEGYGLAPRGHLLLQDHGNEVHFRSLKIRSLD